MHHGEKMRREKIEDFHLRLRGKTRSDAPRDTVFDAERDHQKLVVTLFDVEYYQRCHSKSAEAARRERVRVAMELGEVRETQVGFEEESERQAVDLKLCGLVKAELHVLLSLDDSLNTNQIGGRSFVPNSQLVMDVVRRDGVEVLLDRFHGVHSTAS